MIFLGGKLSPKFLFPSSIEHLVLTKYLDDLDK